jgi:hypothetical protein
VSWLTSDLDPLRPFIKECMPHTKLLRMSFLWPKLPVLITTYTSGGTGIGYGQSAQKMTQAVDWDRIEESD